MRLIIALCLLSQISFAQKNNISYSTELVRGESRVGHGNEVWFRIFSFGKNYSQMSDQKVFERDAVHAVIFNGVAGKVKPLLEEPVSRLTSEQKKFFQSFFGVKDLTSWKKEKKKAILLDYDGYVRKSGQPHPDDVVQYGNKMRIGLPVKVERDRLKKYLKSQGIIK